MKETKNDITPEAIVLEIVNSWGNAKKGMPDFVKLIKEYATIHAARAWDAAVSCESQRDNFLNFCKPITAPNKEQFLQSLK